MSDRAVGDVSLARLAESERFEDLESAWLDELARPVPAERFLQAVGALPEGQERRIGAPLLSLLLEACAEQGAHADALAVTEALLPLRPRNVDLAGALDTALSGLYDGEDWYETFHDMSGLADVVEGGAPALAQALQRFRRLMQLLPGHAVYHASGWGEGAVTGCDLPRRAFTVRFRRDGLERSMPFESGLDVLVALAPDDLRGRLVLDPEGLAEEAQREPEALVRAVARLHQGRAAAREIKQWLCGPVVAERSWASWWKKAKAAAGRDPWLAVDNPSRPTFRLRPNARAPEEELAARLDRAQGATELVAVARGALALDPSETARAVVLERVARAVQDEGAEGSARLEGALLLTRSGQLDGAQAAALLDQLLQGGVGFGALTACLSGAALRREAFDLLVAARPQLWSDAVIGELGELHPTLLDTVFDRLVAAGRGEALANRLHIFLLSPSRQPEVTLRLARRFGDGLLAGVEGAPSDTEVVGGLLRLAETQGPRAARGRREARDVVDDLAGILVPGPDGLLASFGRHGTRSDLEGALGVLARCPSLPESLVGAVRDAVTARFPDLAPAEEAFWEEGGLFCTRAGIARRQEELRVLMEEKIPANAADIGRAASYGDLSENFEWQAAVDQQRQLTEKAAAVQAELKLVRPLEEQTVEAGVVAPGTRVTYEQDGATHSVRVLGPWDVGGDVVSYRAPLAAGMLGARPGESVTVELPSGETYVTVRAVEPAW